MEHTIAPVVVRWVRMPPIAMLAVVLAGCGPCARARVGAGPPAREREHMRRQEAGLVLPACSGLPGHALVCAQNVVDPRGGMKYDVRWVVVWLPSAGDGAAHIVYSAGPMVSLHGRMPVYFGFLPSPDGRWLCVWETRYSSRDGWLGPVDTVWTAAEMPQGKKHGVHAQDGLAGYLPLWIDDAEVQFEKGDVVAVFDVRSGELSRPLPARSVPRDSYGRDIDAYTKAAAEWRREFVMQHFPDGWGVINKALAVFPKELGAADYLARRDYPVPDTPADLLLRPMGIVGLCGYNGDKRTWPSVAVSPDHGLLARAAVVRTGELTSQVAFDGQMGARNTFEARLDVYELPLGRRMWGISVPWSVTLRSDVAVAYPFTRDEAWFGDIRWSADGRYLSFTRHGPSIDHVSVVDASSWEEVVRIAGACNAFVVPTSTK